MNFSAKLRFYFQTRKRFRGKVTEKVGSHALYQAKNLCESVKSVGQRISHADAADDW